MPKLSLSDLAAGDLVLVECNIMRHRSLNPYPGNASWEGWFEMTSVSRLGGRPQMAPIVVADKFPYVL